MPPVAENFIRMAAEGGYETGVQAEYDPRMYHHQLPGGMTGTLKSQLAQHKMMHRLPEVLEAIPAVREELGQPIMATPFSQFVGIQAVLNVVTGDRYAIVPDEVIHYVLGHYGPLPKEIDPDVADRILSSPRAAEIQKWERPNPSLAEIRSTFAAGISDEDLLLRFMCSDEEVDAMLAKGPIRTDPRRSANDIVRNLKDLIAEKRTVTGLSVSTPEFSLSLSR